jgi:hypothetical protein
MSLSEQPGITVETWDYKKTQEVRIIMLGNFVPLVSIYCLHPHDVVVFFLSPVTHLFIGLQEVDLAFAALFPGAVLDCMQSWTKGFGRTWFFPTSYTNLLSSSAACFLVFCHVAF